MYKKIPSNISHDDLWSIVKFYRFIKQRIVSFGNYSFRFNILPNVEKVLHEIDMKYGGQLQSNGTLYNFEKREYLVSSIMEEAISSSQIEGAVTTRKVAKEMLRQQRAPRNKSERMILNNYQTIRFIRQNSDKPLSAGILLEIQKSMTSGTLDDLNDEGRFRSNDEVRVIDSTDNEVVHQPPSARDLKTLMSDLFQFFNEEDKNLFTHPVVKASIIHFMIGFIHPFVDGNGRTARALFYWYLLKRGYWLTEYLSISSIILKTRVQYAKAFLYTETDDNDLTYFINYKIKTLQLAYENLQVYLHRKLEEKKLASNFLSLGGINERQAKIIRVLIDDPDKIITVKEIETMFSVSNQTARFDLHGLEKMKLIRSSFINKKKQVFSRSTDFNQQLKTLEER